MHGFERFGGIADTDTVVVQGAGPVGLFAVAKAVCEGASRVIAIGGPKTRLDLATSWGAATVIDVADVATPRERVQAVRDLTAGRGAEIVLEMSGFPSCRRDQLFGWSAYWPWISPESLKLATSRS
jgi:L-iditol 2-dehydrogenase